MWLENPGRLYNRILQISRLGLPGSTITFLNTVDVEEFKTLMLAMNVHPMQNDPSPELAASNLPAEMQCFKMPDEKGCRGVIIRHIHGDAAEFEILEPLVMRTRINSCIVLGTQSAVRLPPKARDTRVLSILLLLRRLCERKLKVENVPMHVVGENQEDMTAKLALGPRQRGNLGIEGLLRYREPDFVNTQAINARVLVQTLAYPIIRNAIAELFDEAPNGASIELVKAETFIPLGEELSIGVVREMVLLVPNERSIFIGYQNDDGDIYIMPHHTETRVFKKHEYLVVVQRKLTST